MYVLKAGEVCQKRTESVNEKPAISRLFLYSNESNPLNPLQPFCIKGLILFLLQHFFQSGGFHEKWGSDGVRLAVKH